MESYSFVICLADTCIGIQGYGNKFANRYNTGVLGGEVDVGQSGKFY